MVKQIVTWPDARLKQKSQHIDIFNQSLRELEHDLIETCRFHKGAGLAAIQVGVPTRALVVLYQDKYVFMANPAIEELKGEHLFMQEGCLSFPDIFENVKRWERCLVYYKDGYGILKELECDGLTAQAVQHEIDHLDGIVLPDRLDSYRKNKFFKAYKQKSKI